MLASHQFQMADPVANFTDEFKIRFVYDNTFYSNFDSKQVTNV